MSQSSNDNKNKVVVITGCDSGIGLEVAKLSLNWNYYVVACCLNVESYGNEILTPLGADVINLDVCNSNMVEELVQKLTRLQSNGKDIWCLINNAGVMVYAKSEWMTWNFVQSQILVNLSGTIQMTRSLLPFLRQSKGRIINVSSPQAFLASPYMSVYCSSKWGIEAFSTAVRRENEEYDVKVIIIRPCSLPNKTLILKRNFECLSQMKKEMNYLTLQEFKQEIEAMENLFKNEFSEETPGHEINDPYLTKCFRSAIDSPSPSRIYTAAPLCVRVLLQILSLIPESVMDYLVRRGIPNKIIDLAKS